MSFPIFNRSTGKTINFGTKEERDNYVTDNDLSIYQGQLPELIVRTLQSQEAHEQRVRNLTADRSNPESLYRMHDRQAMSDPASPYNAAKGWIMFNTGIAGSAFNPGLATLGITGDVIGQTIGDKISKSLKNPDKKIKLNADTSITPRQIIRYGTGFVLGGAASTGPSLRRFYTNTRNLQHGFRTRDIEEISSNPIIHKALDSPITEHFLTKTNPGKRALETLMRTTSAPNPIPEVLRGIQELPWKPRVNYILFGKNPRLRKFFKQPRMHYGDNSWNVFRNSYRGLEGERGPIIIQKGYGDIIDAFLYQKRIDPKIATLSSDNNGRLYFNKYINDNYPDKNILEYEVLGNVNPDQVVRTDGWNSRTGTQFEEFLTNDGNSTINVGGHHYQMGYSDLNSKFPRFQRSFDIWKFQPDDYKHWGVGNNYLEQRGVQIVDKAGTPIIFKQPWKTLY